MSQTLRQWLDGYGSNVPDELIGLVNAMLEAQLELPVHEVDLASVVEREMGKLLSDAQLNNRSSAGNLLAIDAIATLSFLIPVDTNPITSQQATQSGAVTSMISSINSLVRAHG